jgi:membrane protease YdiL (CAAX protease family)
LSYNPENRPNSNQPYYNYGANQSEQPASDILDALNSTENFFQPQPQQPQLQPSFLGANMAPVATPDPATTPISKIKLPTPALSTFCFFLCIALFEGLGFLLKNSKVSSIMVTVIGEIGIIAAIPIIFTGLGGFTFNAVFSVRKLPFYTVFLCMVLGLAAQLAIIVPNMLGLWLLQQIGPLYQSADSSSSDVVTNRLIFSFAALVLAPLCEETLNRGFLMAGYRHFGLVRTIIIIGLFFGLFHMYPYKFVGTGLGGIILAYLAYSTGSIYASMAAHFGFNLLPTIILWINDPLHHIFANGVLASFQTTLGYNYIPRGDVEATLPGSSIVAAFFISAIGLGLLIFLLRRITKLTTQQRPGLTLNYFGLATSLNENSTVFENGAFFGPNPSYAYGEYGFSYRPTTQTAPVSNYNSVYTTNIGQQPSSAGWGQPLLPNNATTATQPTQAATNQHLVLGLAWLLVFMVYAVGVYTEMNLRLIGHDCNVNGFQSCESKLPKGAVVAPVPDNSALPQLINLK